MEDITKPGQQLPFRESLDDAGASSNIIKKNVINYTDKMLVQIHRSGLHYAKPRCLRLSSHASQVICKPGIVDVRSSGNDILFFLSDFCRRQTS